MRTWALAAVTVVSCLTGCSTSEVKQGDPTIVMSVASVNTNSTAAGIHASQSDIKTPFREYDERMIREIQRRWYKLMDSVNLPWTRGEVIMDFRLHPDGRVTDLQERPTKMNAIAVLICERAIRNRAPFEPFTADMRTALGDRAREVTFTFKYQ